MLAILQFKRVTNQQNNLQEDPPRTCSIPIISNGIVTDNNNEELLVGDQLKVQCGQNYRLSRTEFSICQDDGLINKLNIINKF